MHPFRNRLRSAKKSLKKFEKTVDFLKTVWYYMQAVRVKGHLLGSAANGFKNFLKNF